MQYHATYSKTHWEKLCQRVALTLHIWGFSCKSLLLGLPNQQCMSPRLRFLHSSFPVRSKHHDHQYHFHPQLLQGGAASGLTSNQYGITEHSSQARWEHIASILQSPQPSSSGPGDSAWDLLGLLGFRTCCLKRASAFMGYCNHCLWPNLPREHGKGKEVMV